MPRKLPGAFPRLVGRQWSNKVAQDIQDWLRKMWQGMADLQSDPQPPETLDGVKAADAGDGPSPALDDHVHRLNVTGVPGAITNASTQGPGPGIMRSGHTHKWPGTTEGGIIITDPTGGPTELAIGTKLEQLTVDAGSPANPIWNPQPDWPSTVVAQFTATPINDLDLDPAVGLFVFSSDAANYELTGIDHGDEGLGARVIDSLNNGTFNIIVKDQDTRSVAANRIVCGGGADITLIPDDVAHLIYSPTRSRWFAVLS